MAEIVDSVEVEFAVKVTIDYEEFIMSEETARALRDELNTFLNRL